MATATVIHAGVPLAKCHFIFTHLKGGHCDVVDRLLVIISIIGTHTKTPRRNSDHLRLITASRLSDLLWGWGRWCPTRVGCQLHRIDLVAAHKRKHLHMPLVPRLAYLYLVAPRLQFHPRLVNRANVEDPYPGIGRGGFDCEGEGLGYPYIQFIDTRSGEGSKPPSGVALQVAL